MEKILLISLKLNYTPNTLGCYGLKVTHVIAYFSSNLPIARGSLLPPKIVRFLTKFILYRRQLTHHTFTYSHRDTHFLDLNADVWAIKTIISI